MSLTLAAHGMLKQFLIYTHLENSLILSIALQEIHGAENLE